ncbi:hypothetical protein Kfla_3109 [Kribbella flavida DSM 17836]|uniref:Uncharacterized protein n=1 Tax=Kribbella flavida (strain DSM 17836 / JCM 10339 / NBRC 14399) TaxID=479435 RepID=D2Q348_KRIFD|nr:hypothetical protein [Kribbella flavida]ADB32173.1 hypothetical protein Kfla_3109 [Kribbella flavida DSM 17836]
MSNQQPPYGQGGPNQPPYGGQPPHGQPPYQGGPPQQPPYQGQPQGQPPYQPGPPPQGQPPYQGRPPQQPPYQGQPPQQPPYQGPPQGQPPYQPGPPPQYPGQQQAPYQGQQPGYPPQGPPQGYPGGPPQFPGQQAWGPGPQGHVPRGQGKGSNKILLLAGGAVAVVAVIGIVLSLIFGGDDTKVEPDPQPTTDPTTQPTGNVDEGIEVAEGVFVKPAPGYIRKSLDKFNGVYLLKQGEAYFMVNSFKANGESTATVLPQLLGIEKKATPGDFTSDEPKERKPGADDKTPVKVVTTQSFQATATSQNGSFPVIGFVGVIERNDGVMTIIRVYGRRDKADSVKTDSAAMLKSVVASQ